MLTPCQTDQKDSDHAQFESTLSLQEKQSNWCLINACAFDFRRAHTHPSLQKRCKQNHVFPPKIKMLFPGTKEVNSLGKSIATTEGNKATSG